MRRPSLHWFGYVVLALSAGSFSGCSGGSGQKQQLPIPDVTVAPPMERQVTDYEFFTGRTEAIEKVEIRARVSGYLEKIEFEPGAEVEKGQPLFLIDRRTYQADLDKANGDMKITKARVERLKLDFKRVDNARRLNAVSPEEFDRVNGDLMEAEAGLTGMEAKIASAKLNLEFTHILAPITGRVGDRMVTQGNLVTGGQGQTTLLTTIVSVDPMFVAFDMDENTLQRIKKAVDDGKIRSREERAVPVEVGLAIDGDAYPVKGVIKFFDNQIKSTTGTLRMKAELPNPKANASGRKLAPGNFVRVRIPLTDPYKAMLVPEAALGSDQGQAFLFVVGADNKAMRLDATLGRTEGSLRVIDRVQGVGDKEPRALKADEMVIVRGVQRVRPGQEVKPLKAGQTPG